MQILKGEAMKSVTVQQIIKNTHSICFVYYEEALFLDGYYINSNKYTLDQLKEYIQDFINNDIKDIIFDYLILYTNKTEEELADIINWLREEEKIIGVRCIMVTCR